MTEAELKMILDLQRRGFAIVIFSPDELGDETPEIIESVMIERAWNFINPTEVE